MFIYVFLEMIPEVMNNSDICQGHDVLLLLHHFKTFQRTLDLQVEFALAEKCLW